MGARTQCPGASESRSHLLTQSKGQQEDFSLLRSTLVCGPRPIINFTPSFHFSFHCFAPKEVGIYGNTHSVQWSIHFQPNKSMWLQFHAATTQNWSVERMQRCNKEMLSAEAQRSHALGFLACIYVTAPFHPPSVLANSCSSFNSLVVTRLPQD